MSLSVHNGCNKNSDIHPMWNTAGEGGQEESGGGSKVARRLSIGGGLTAEGRMFVTPAA